MEVRVSPEEARRRRKRRCTAVADIEKRRVCRRFEAREDDSFGEEGHGDEAHLMVVAAQVGMACSDGATARPWWRSPFRWFT
jgi:hypothetical protein